MNYEERESEDRAIERLMRDRDMLREALVAMTSEAEHLDADLESGDASAFDKAREALKTTEGK